MKYVTLWTLGVGLSLNLVGCAEEFSSPEPLGATIAQLDWPDAIVVTDTIVLEVEVRDAGGRRVLVPLEWEASPAGVVEVSPLAADPDSSDPADGVKARVTALRPGEVEILVRTRPGGPLQEVEYRESVTVHMRWISISAGYNHACGVTVENDAYCWGGGFRLLGNGASSGSNTPTLVLGQLPFASASAGWEHSCGRVLDGLLFCWGFNAWGAVGNATTDDQLAPAPLERGPGFNSFRAGFGFTCGVSAIDSGVCWGLNEDGQLGSPAADDICEGLPCSTEPVAVRANGTLILFQDLSAGDRNTCGVLLDGSAVCWGNNANGTLGTNQVGGSLSPVPVAGGLTFRKISIGRYHACALTDTGTAYCWGTNLFGELGNPMATDLCDGLPCSRTPLRVATDESFETIDVRERNTCAVSADGTGYCWGLNFHGQLGTPSSDVCAGQPCAKQPIPIAGLRFLNISVGDDFSCGLAIDGSAYCWGEAEDGKLGSGSLSDTTQPQRIGDPP